MYAIQYESYKYILISDQMKKDQNQQPRSIDSKNYDSQKETKQCFLRQQIIGKEYSPEEFVEFLNKQLHIDSNIDQCSIQDLKKVVTIFQKQKSEEDKKFRNSNRSHQSHQSYDQADTMICQKLTIVEDSQPKMIVISEYPKIKEEQFQHQIKCVKIIPKIDPKKQVITCEIGEPQRIHSHGVLGLGATSYLCFKVWAHGLSQSFVKRRYGDFIWLRNMLLKFNPTQIIPPIPNKKASKRSPRQILKRMRILEMFLNDLVKNPILANNKYVEGFLMFKDDKLFQMLKQEGQNRKAFESMLSAQTLTGNVTLQLSDRTINYRDGLTKFIPQVEAIYKEITQKSKTMRQLNGDKINTLYDMANKFADLHGISLEFDKFVNTQGITKLSKIYVALNNMMIEWGNSMKKQMDQIEKNLCTFFKYIREQFMGMKQLIARESKVEIQFIKQKQAIDKQKQKIFNLHDPKKWGISKEELKYIPKSAIYDRNQAFKIMLPKQSVKMNELKDEMGYYLSQIYLNGNQYFLGDAEKFCQNFREFVIRAKVNNQEIGAMWMELSAKFSDPYKKHAIIQKMENINQLEQISFGQSSIFQ